MALADSQQLLLLERLRRAGTQPVALDELRAGGIYFPAVVISELELHGYAIERVHEHGRLIGVRLLETNASATPASRRRWRRRSR
jgi:hypothetical protein